MDVEDRNVEEAIIGGGPLQDLYDRPDGVVLAPVMVEPQLIEPFTTALEKMMPGVATSPRSDARIQPRSASWLHLDFARAHAH